MEITLTVTSSDSLPQNILRDFGKKAEEQGKSADALLAELIYREVFPTPRKKKGAAK